MNQILLQLMIIAISRMFVVLVLTSVLTSSLRADEDSDAITQASMRYVFQNAGVDDPAVTIVKKVPGFARVAIKSISGKTDPAIAFLKGANGKWKVLTLGTFFTREELTEMGVPLSLAD